MGFLTDNANKSFSKLSKRAYVPEWYTTVAGIGALVLVGIILLISFMRPGAPDPVSGPPLIPGETATSEPSEVPTVSEPSDLPTDSETEPVASPSAPTEPDAGETTVVDTISGESTTVPKGAYDQAVNAAVALYSGDFSKVRLPEGVNAPVDNPNPAAALVSIRASEINASAITFIAQVDSTGAGELRTVNITVAQEDSGWTFFPTAA